MEKIQLIAYPEVGSNNADLPENGFIITGRIPSDAQSLFQSSKEIPFDQLFRETQIFLAPTEYSATAPLKIAARKFGFRAATMAGFSSQMIPALQIDYNEVNRRVHLLKEKLNDAVWAKVHFIVDDSQDCYMFFDLRFRKAQASSGRFPQKGMAGNLPSGETYIVPYEGENESSLTEGTLPVEINKEVVFFIVRENRAIKAEGVNPSADREREHLQREPAYGNIAELGFGVLADFGLQPIGKLLLDEKLGFHIAFGRSDHFGGQIGAQDFSSPEEVIHLDHIYIPETQSRIHLRTVIFGYHKGSEETILANGKYLIF